MKNYNYSKAIFFNTVAVLFLVLLSAATHADELRPAYLQLIEQKPNIFSTLWKLPAKGQQRLPLELHFNGVTLAESSILLKEPVSAVVGGVYIQQSLIVFDRGLPGTEITINGLPRTSTDVLLRIEYLDGATLTHRLTPASPSLVVADKPTLLQTAHAYLMLGVEHILFGIDHLLFVLALLLLIDNTRKLIMTITFFTIAHSMTLSLAALNIVQVPVPPVEAIIALSIVFVAGEIIRVQRGGDSLTFRKPWIVAFGFGLLHGLGFAAALDEIGLPENAVILALILFNLGVELGQIAFVVAFIVAGYAASTLSSNRVANLRPTTLKTIPPYIIGSLASFWVIERTVGFWG